MSVQQYQVKGMTCEHCARAVRNELSELPGVEDVAVDVATGVVTVRAAGALVVEQVRAAVAEAGYEFVG